MFSGRGSSGYVIAGDNNIRLGFGVGYTTGETAMLISSSGNIAIGKTTTNSKLDISGSVIITGSLLVTGSFVPPVMTSASRAALVTPATGSVVYQSDSASGLYVYKGTSWVNLTSAEIYTFLHGSQSPTANNTYYIGNFPDTGTPQNTTDIRGKVIAQHTGLVTSAVVAQYSSTNSSTEVSATASLSIWNTNTGISSSITDKLYYTASSIASSMPCMIEIGPLISPSIKSFPFNLKDKSTPVFHSGFLNISISLAVKLSNIYWTGRI